MPDGGSPDIGNIGIQRPPAQPAEVRGATAVLDRPIHLTETKKPALATEAHQAPETHKNFPLTAADIRTTNDYIAITHQMTKALDEGSKPNADVVAALYAKAIEVETESFIFNEVYKDMDIPLADVERHLAALPWPQSAEGKTGNQLSVIPDMWKPYNNNHIRDYIKPGISKTFPHGIITNDDDLTVLEEVTLTSFRKLSEPEKGKVVNYVMDLYEKGYELPMGIDIFETVYANNSKETTAQLVDSISKHRNEYTFTRFKTISDSKFTAPGYFDNHPQVAEYFLANILDRPVDEQQQLFKIALDMFDYPPVIDGLRTLLAEKNLSPKQQTTIERFGRTLLGVTPDDTSITFHPSLNSVYESLKDFFATYEPNVEVNNQELDMIRQTIQAYVDARKAAGLPLGDTRVIDLGCGTGRIANGLAQTVTGIKEIVGIDASPDLLNVATNEYQTLDTITTPVIYQQGTWNDYNYVYNEVTHQNEWQSSLKLPPNSADAIVCVGRTLSHAEDEKRFGAILRQVHAGLKENGIFLFDFPDPNKGAYRDNRLNLLHGLQRIGLPVDEAYLPQLDYTVDSADGRNLYNRYTPQLDRLQQILLSYGFELQEIKRSEIAGDLWKGSENVYFQARKLTEAEQQKQKQKQARVKSYDLERKNQLFPISPSPFSDN